MKTIKIVVLFIFIANIGLVKAQYTAIPDSCFEQHLIDLGIDSDGIINGQVLTTDINTITELTMNGIDISGNDYGCYIDNLQGIDDFIALETLDFSINGVQYIDVSNLPNLKNLYCDDNFTQTLVLPPSIEIVYARYNRYSQNIDLSQTINLTEIHLDAFWNSNESHITEVNVSNCPNLIELTADFNDIINLDTSNNPLLEILSIGENTNQSLTTFIHNNPQLKTLILVGNLTFLDISEMVNLEYFLCVANSISTIDLTNQIHLYNVKIRNDDTLTKIDLRNNNNNLITDFQVLNNPNLSCIYVDNITYSQSNWTDISSNSTFVETEAECNALAINETALGNNLTIYPNPVKDILNIEITNTTIKEIIIYNILGKEVIKSNKNKIDLSALKNGIYIVRIKTNDNEIISKKIIKIGV